MSFSLCRCLYLMQTQADSKGKKDPDVFNKMSSRTRPTAHLQIRVFLDCNNHLPPVMETRDDDLRPIRAPITYDDTQERRT